MSGAKYTAPAPSHRPRETREPSGRRQALTTVVAPPSRAASSTTFSTPPPPTRTAAHALTRVVGGIAGGTARHSCPRAPSPPALRHATVSTVTLTRAGVRQAPAVPSTADEVRVRIDLPRLTIDLDAVAERHGGSRPTCTARGLTLVRRHQVRGRRAARRAGAARGRLRRPRRQPPARAGAARRDRPGAAHAHPRAPGGRAARRRRRSPTACCCATRAPPACSASTPPAPPSRSCSPSTSATAARASCRRTPRRSPHELAGAARRRAGRRQRQLRLPLRPAAVAGAVPAGRGRPGRRRRPLRRRAGASASAAPASSSTWTATRRASPPRSAPAAARSTATTSSAAAASPASSAPTRCSRPPCSSATASRRRRRGPAASTPSATCPTSTCRTGTPGTPWSPSAAGTWSRAASARSSPGAYLAGATSDVCILITPEPLRPGDEVRFAVDYDALVRAVTSPFVTRGVRHGGGGATPIDRDVSKGDS